MNKKIKIRLMVLFFIFTLLVNTGVFARNFTSENEKVSDGDMLAEWLVRPASALGTIAGFATFVLGLPFSVTADNTQESFDVLVKEPLEYTIHRPLGHYSVDGNY
jgi:hypothetical protein